jgi:hypothetical protein
MVGNHDWFFHLPGSAYDAIRAKIINAMGLSNATGEPFPHDALESPVLAKLFQEHQVTARHSDIFDPWNYVGERNASSIGDAIVLELLNRFPAEVEKRMAGELPQECFDGLREIDNVRPLPVIPGWIAGLLHRTCAEPRQAKGVRDIWNELADAFLAQPFVRENDKAFRWDVVDALQLGLKLSRDLSLSNLDRLTKWWSERVANKPTYKHALSERDFKNRMARHIVYGHTHRHEIVPLDSCYTAKGLFNQMYVNTGTWRRVHERAVWTPTEQEFMDYYVMTYAAFFNNGERTGRSFEIWNGALL